MNVEFNPDGSLKIHEKKSNGYYKKTTNIRFILKELVKKGGSVLN